MKLSTIMAAGVCFFLMLNRAGSAEEKGFCFPVGEKLVYKLYWGFISVGRAELSAEWAELDGRRVLSFKALAKTTSIVAKIYPVNDYIESIVDPDTFLPLVYIQKLQEGRHVRDDKVTFRHSEGVAKWEKGDGKRRKDIKIDADTRDVLCLIYNMRTRGFHKEQKEKFRVLVDDKLYDLEVTGIGYEELDVGNYGDIKCLEVEPRAKFGEIFVRKGSVRAWFSEDSRRICTRMTGKVPLARVKGYLIDVQGPGDDFWVSGGGNKGEGMEEDPVDVPAGESD